MTANQHTNQIEVPVSELLCHHPVDSVVVDRLGSAVWNTEDFFEKFDSDFIRDVMLRLDCEMRSAGTKERSVFHLLYSRSFGDSPREYTVAAQKVRESYWLISIADRKMMDAEAARTEQEHAVLTKMLAVFAHEFRNPLVAVELATEVLKEKNARQTPDADIGKKLNTLGDGIKQMKRLLNDLEDYHRFSRGKISIRKQLFDLRSVIASIVHEYHLKGEKHVHLKEQGPAKAMVFGDEERIRQVITNLIGNAIKFSPEQAPVEIELGQVAGICKVTVRDQGVGMTENTRSHISKPFFQVSQGVSREQGGLGLGTYICKTIVDLHNGDLSYHSDGENQGTTVEIRLPVGRALQDTQQQPIPQQPQEQSRPRAQGVSGLPTHQPKVLIVEDHSSCLNAYQMALEDCHAVDVHYAASGSEALNLLRQNRYSLVITDLGLPDVSGYDLIESYHAESGRESAPEFVLITGYGSDEERSKSKALGFVEHIVKPLSLEKLRTLVLTRSNAKAANHESEFH